MSVRFGTTTQWHDDAAARALGAARAPTDAGSRGQYMVTTVDLSGVAVLVATTTQLGSR